MYRRSAALVALLLAAFVPDASADANSLNDNLGPREIAIGEAMRADSRGSLATTLNPAGLGLDTALVFEGSAGHRPGDGAYGVNLSACDSTVPVPGCFYYRYFSADPTVGGDTMSRSAHELGSTVARRLSPRLLLGFTAKWFDYSSDLMNEGEGDADGFSFDAGLTFRVSPQLNLAVVGYNLWGEDSAQYPRAIGSGFTFRPSPRLVLGFDGLWDLEAPEGQSTGRYGGGAEFVVGSGQSLYPLRAGGVYDKGLDAGYVTGGVGVITMKMGLDVGLRKQVSGGDELMVVGSLRVFGPRPAQNTGFARAR